MLSISLELAEGLWHPEGEDGRALTVYAFGETGGPLQNPGPLIRVPLDTEIHVTLHNALPVAATVHGLHERPGSATDALILQSSATKDVRFKAGAPGTYYYWASTTNSQVDERTPMETQLAGAFIVDPPGVPTTDRVFVIGIWFKDAPFRARSPVLATINGKSWPYTERFTFKLGETVRWRWLNPSVSEHAMHLHGFYYHLDGVGDAERYKSYKEAERPLVVTKFIETGQNFDMTWVPERAGRWLFHCHMLLHMSPPEWSRLADKSEQGTATTKVHPELSYSPERQDAGMGGLVLGMTILGSESVKLAAWHVERRLQLILDERTGGTQPRYALQLRDLGQPRSPSLEPATQQWIGPTVVLARGQSVEIELVNRSKQPTAIHWHGIELESYYDGVAGWTGTPLQTTPAIKPGESFLVRMAPPRAGTFIYHTHWHDRNQLENGLYGPLIVTPDGREFDPQSDKIFLFSLGAFEPFGPLLLLNGHPQPSPLSLVIGKKYRFRLINIAPDNARMRASLRKAGVPVQWRAVAKDGADLPPVSVTLQTAEFPITVGETYDYEYEASTPEELTLEVYLPGPKQRVTQTLMFVANLSGNSSTSTPK